MRSALLIGAVAVAFVALVAVALAYWEGSPPADATLALSQLASETESPSYRPDSSRLRFAVAPVLSPRATLENYEALAVYLGERLGRPVELVQGKSYAEINALVRAGDVSFALVCSGAYVQGRREFGMQALVVPVVNGDTTYRSYLIVPSDSPDRGWEDLRNKRFAFTDPLSNTGRLVPVYVLSRMGETPERFFQDFIFTYSHDNSIEAVAEGLVDGAAVDSLVYDYLAQTDPALAAKTRIVWKSPAYGINPVVVHPRVDPEFRARLAAILLGMNGDLKGRKVLARLGVDAFVPSDAGAYDSIEEMMRATGAQ